MTTLAPCSICSRHVRASETACPFCEAPFDGARVVAARAGRMPLTTFRVALLLGAALELEACAHAIYGAPNHDGGAPGDTGTSAAAPLTGEDPSH